MKMFTTFIIAIGLLVSASAERTEKLPNSMPRCSQSDPQLNECLKNAIQSSIPTLAQGLPKLRMMPLDPLAIQSLDINQGTGKVRTDLNLRDIKLRGPASAVVTDVQSDLKNYKITISAYLTKPIEIDSDYTLRGTILVLPVSGDGKCQIKLTDVKVELFLSGQELKKNGRSHFELNDFKVKLDTSRLYTNFENLLSKEKDLGYNINQFLNENWREIFQDLKPAIENALGAAFKDITSGLFMKVPMEDIFLP